MRPRAITFQDRFPKAWISSGYDVCWCGSVWQRLLRAIRRHRSWFPSWDAPQSAHLPPKPPHRQIPMAANRRPGGPRVPSWEAFGRQPSKRARIGTTGRHPKPFTKGDLRICVPCPVMIDHSTAFIADQPANPTRQPACVESGLRATEPGCLLVGAVG